MIRMNRRSRSSRPTGPKMRVPRGCIWSFDEHGGVLVEADVAAVGAPRSLAVRTTTHLTTSPFFTAAPGMASLTVATKTSPMLA